MNCISFGSLNIDYTYRVDHFVRKGETLSSSSLELFPGGKGLNQSIAMARAGLQVCHAGAIGKDGLFLKELLEENGVDTGLLQVLPEMKTGHAIIQNDVSGDNCILLYGGANQCMTKEYVDRVLSQCQTGDLLLLQNEINELPYIIEEAHKKHLKVVLNPSPMDGKITEAMLKMVDLLILNEVEAGEITAACGGSPENEKDEASQKLTDTLAAETRKFLSENPAMAALLDGLSCLLPQAEIVLTMGEAGALYLKEGEVYDQPAFKVKAVDTTAAGDTFTGYFLAGLLRGDAPEQILQQAAKASALAVTRKGASVSIPRAEEIL